MALHFDAGLAMGLAESYTQSEKVSMCSGLRVCVLGMRVGCSVFSVER